MFKKATILGLLTFWVTTTVVLGEPIELEERIELIIKNGLRNILVLVLTKYLELHLME